MEAEISIGMPRPTVSLHKSNFYGDKLWRERTKSALEFRFEATGHRTTPLVTTRAITSSGFLIKDTQIVANWKKLARDLMAVEMELTGVYAAARRRDREYPVIAIRGISDLVGFKRGAEWTAYACQTAASFCLSLLRNIPPNFLSAPRR